MVYIDSTLHAREPCSRFGVAEKCVDYDMIYLMIPGELRVFKLDLYN